MSSRIIRLIKNIKINNNNNLTFYHLKKSNVKFSDFYDFNIKKLLIYDHYEKLIIDEDENFEFSLIFWYENGFSKLHHHSNKHCIFRVLEGNLKEIKISNDNKYITKLNEDKTYEINDKDYHQVINLDDKKSITFNIYKKN